MFPITWQYIFLEVLGGEHPKEKTNQNKIRNQGLVQASNNYWVQYITYLFILEDLDLVDDKKAWKV